MYRKASVDIDLVHDLECVSAAELAVRVGDQCVVENDRITDYGRITAIEECEGDLPADRKMPRLLRRATLQDQAKANENAVLSRIAMNKCGEVVKKMNLDIRPIKGRYSFDRAVLTVIVTTEQKMDFRDFAQNLSTELRTRVDVKAIGVRDEAGLTGGMGPCGRAICCAVWLRNFESINVRMAKTQGISPSPNVINGQCGRLKCCLKYEDECYRELAKAVPMEGTAVQCPDGQGHVLERKILRRRLRVRLDDGKVVEYGIEQVKPVLRTGHVQESVVKVREEKPADEQVDRLHPDDE